MASIAEQNRELLREYWEMQVRHYEGIEPSNTWDSFWGLTAGESLELAKQKLKELNQSCPHCGSPLDGGRCTDVGDNVCRWVQD